MSTSTNIHVQDGQKFNVWRTEDGRLLVFDLTDYPSSATVFISDEQFDALMTAVMRFRRDGDIVTPPAVVGDGYAHDEPERDDGPVTEAGTYRHDDGTLYRAVWNQTHTNLYAKRDDDGSYAKGVIKELRASQRVADTAGQRIAQRRNDTAKVDPTHTALLTAFTPKTDTDDLLAHFGIQ